MLAAQDREQLTQVLAALEGGPPQRQELAPHRRAHLLERLGDGGAHPLEHQRQERDLVNSLGRHLAQQPIGRVAVDLQRGPIREQGAVDGPGVEQIGVPRNSDRPLPGVTRPGAGVRSQYANLHIGSRRLIAPVAAAVPRQPRGVRRLVRIQPAGLVDQVAGAQRLPDRLMRDIDETGERPLREHGHGRTMATRPPGCRRKFHISVASGFSSLLRPR